MTVSGAPKLKPESDVIIVGCGPAGATLAYELASKGIRVLVLEKTKFPRYKCCAGGLTIKAAHLLGEDLHGLVDNAISDVTIALSGRNPYHGYSSEPIMYTVTREKFDLALMKRAEKAGVDLLQDREVRSIAFNREGVDVSTVEGNLRCKIIAGADGARSVVARAAGADVNKQRLIAIETEVLVDRNELARWKSHVAIDIGRIPAGYGWVFPKASHLSIGMGCLADEAKNLKHFFLEFLQSLQLGHYTIDRWTADILPMCTGSQTLAHGRAILLGDAATLADPLTGEGLHNAIFSAQLAAPPIQKFLNGDEQALEEYRRCVEEKIISDMRIAYTFSKVLAHLPLKLFGLLDRDERVWKAGCRLLTGETNYQTIAKELGSLGGLPRFLNLKGQLRL